jgi:hypothetical protein
VPAARIIGALNPFEVILEIKESNKMPAGRIGHASGGNRELSMMPSASIVRHRQQYPLHVFGKGAMMTASF